MTTSQVDTALAQFRADGYAIIRGFFDPQEAAELKAKSDELYAIGIQHPVTYRHGNLAYEILPEKHFGKRYLIQAYWFAWAARFYDELRSRHQYLDVLRPVLGDDVPVGSLSASDIEAVRLEQAPRGYRMEDVDVLVERLTLEIEARDAEIGRLRGTGTDESPAAP